MPRRSQVENSLALGVFWLYAVIGSLAGYDNLRFYVNTRECGEHHGQTIQFKVLGHALPVDGVSATRNIVYLFAYFNPDLPYMS